MEQSADNLLLIYTSINVVQKSLSKELQSSYVTNTSLTPLSANKAVLKKMKFF